MGEAPVGIDGHLVDVGNARPRELHDGTGGEAGSEHRDDLPGCGDSGHDVERGLGGAVADQRGGHGVAVGEIEGQ